ncbi:MAG: InlB B-repeat-containing protein, partial [Clostridiales Family XIII bacterium]|nr:InlB B-repeat-containing protein [Clostridiales Family XIII bacterium]
GEAVDISEWPYSIRYFKSGDPNYSADGIVHGGSGTTTTLNIAEAKSFDFSFNNSKRLPPGYSVLLHGTIAAPATASSSDIGKTAYNSFAVNTKYYPTATGGTGVEAGAWEPKEQTFVLAEANNARITNSSGVIFKDKDANNTYASGSDAAYAGVNVTLFRTDAAGTHIEGVEYHEVTDADGRFAFDHLPGGYYTIRVSLPTGAPTGASYSFATRGADDSATASHIDPLTGESGVIQLNSGETLHKTFNAGIRATAAYTVEFRENSADGALVSSVSGTKTVDGTSVTIIPGTTTGYGPPANYHIKAGTDTQRTYTPTFDDLTETLVFVVAGDLFTLSYDLNTADELAVRNDGAASETVAYNAAISSAANYASNSVGGSTAPIRTGYTFGGWYLDAATTQAVGSAPMPAEATAIYAKWDARPVTVEYNVNGGIEEIDDVEGTYGQVLSPAPANPTKAGYTFAGWYSDSDKTDSFTHGETLLTTANNVVDYETPSIATGNATLTLYAKWDANTYTISYDKGSNRASGSMDSVPALFDGDLTLAPNAFTYAGYTFSGWDAAYDERVSGEGSGANYQDFDGKADFTDKNSFLPWNIAANVQLKALWTAGNNTPYTVEHYLVSSAGTVKEDTDTLTGRTDTLATAVPRNYTGYTLNASHSQAVSAGIIDGAGRLVLRLYYEINVYTVTFTDGSDKTLDTQAVEYGEDATAPQDPSRDGFTFDGWDKEFANITADLTVAATWRERAAATPPNAPVAQTPTESTDEPGGNTPTAPAGEPGRETPAGPADESGGDTPTGPADKPTSPSTGTLTDGPNPPTSNGGTSVGIDNQSVPTTSPDSTSAASLVFSAFAFVNAILLAAGALMRRKRGDETDKRKGRGLLQAFALITGIATPVIWFALDWPFTNLTFANQWSPYVAAAFVANVGLTLAYNFRKGGRVVKTADEAK